MLLTALRTIGVARGTTLHKATPSNRAPPTNFRTSFFAAPSNQPAVGIFACLVTREAFADCAVQVEFRRNRGNSGLFVRSDFGADLGFVSGYEADIWPGAMGKLSYDRKVLFRPDKALQERVFKSADWNLYRIEAQGKRIRVWLNGTLMTEYTDAVVRPGRVALQLEDSADVEFRNVQVQKLTPAP